MLYRQTSNIYELSPPVQQPIEMKPLPANSSPVCKWEFPRDRLTLTTTLGSGVYGVVMQGIADGINGRCKEKTIVAVKTVKGIRVTT